LTKQDILSQLMYIVLYIPLVDSTKTLPLAWKHLLLVLRKTISFSEK